MKKNFKQYLTVTIATVIGITVGFFMGESKGINVANEVIGAYDSVINTHFKDKHMPFGEDKEEYEMMMDTLQNFVNNRNK